MKLLNAFIFIASTLFSIESIAAWEDYWQKSYIYDGQGNLATIYKYRHTNAHKQVVVLNGGIGTISENVINQYINMARYFANKGRQVVVLSLDYYGSYANTTLAAAQNVRDTLGNAMAVNHISRGFWLYSTSGGTLIAAAMFDYGLRDRIFWLPMTEVCDRVIFISGPVHGIAQNDIQNPTITNLMRSKGVASLDSLNENLNWTQRRANWATPMIQKKNGIRFVHSSNDYAYCAGNQLTPCSAQSIPHAINDWIVNATDGIWNAQGLKNTGLLKILSTGGHDPLQSSKATELLDFVSH